MQDLPLFVRAATYDQKIAIRADTDTYSYAHLLEWSKRIAFELLGSQADLAQQRVALIAPPDARYVCSQWGIWRAGGICVPLSISGTDKEWEYMLTDSESTVVIATSEFATRAQNLCDRLRIQFIDCKGSLAAHHEATRSLPSLAASRDGMILYTSGTTSKPKGVVTTHANIEAQISSLIAAWEWSHSDVIPLFLPLHHIHGIINVLSCALWSGATVEMFPRFDAHTILQRVATKAFTIFMAVPTIYVKLIDSLEQADPSTRAAWIRGFQHMRLMVSGSAALPSTLFDHWQALTGQRLLERYGMTEIGMALSNPYHQARRAGTVGQPLPGVQVRLKNEAGTIVAEENAPGEIQICGPTVFKEYWRRPQATLESFDDGWFRTGDIAVVESGYYRILGRQSVDIIKSGGYKLSALEIEGVLLDHPAIRECAVVGLPHEVWGEAVTAVVVLKPQCTLDTSALRTWCKEYMSSYKIPHHLIVVPELPRNAMGKVTKPAVKDLASQILRA